MKQHRARKRFGQNFLHDQAVIAQIIAAIHPQADQHIVEIGPGKGALSKPLLEALQLLNEKGFATHGLDVVELDRDLPALLRESCNGFNDDLRIHLADALKFNFCDLVKNNERLRVTGNLPYNISTPLIFHLLQQLDCIQDMHFMLQKEVVERLSAAPGSSAYGRLSVMVQYRCQVENLFTVYPGSFIPAPKVDSAIVRLTPYTKPPVQVHDEKKLALLVTQAFSQRRKTIRNTLKTLLSAEQIISIDIDPGLRAEKLTLEQFAKLSNLLEDGL